MADVACGANGAPAGEINVQDLVDGINSKVDRVGDIMTGPLEVPAGASGSQVVRASEIDAKIALVEADTKLGPLGKIIVKADGTRISGGIIAAVRFDGKATPPVILGDAANVTSVVRNATGHYTITFGESMDNTNFTAVGNSDFSECHVSIDGQTLTTMNVINVWHNGTKTNDVIDVLVFGGVN